MITIDMAFRPFEYFCKFRIYLKMGTLLWKSTFYFRDDIIRVVMNASSIWLQISSQNIHATNSLDIKIFPREYTIFRVESKPVIEDNMVYAGWYFFQLVQTEKYFAQQQSMNYPHRTVRGVNLFAENKLR